MSLASSFTRTGGRFSSLLNSLTATTSWILSRINWLKSASPIVKFCAKRNCLFSSSQTIWVSSPSSRMKLWTKKFVQICLDNHQSPNSRCKPVCPRLLYCWRSFQIHFCCLEMWEEEEQLYSREKSQIVISGEKTNWYLQSIFWFGMIFFYGNFSIYGKILPFQSIVRARERQRTVDKHISIYVGNFNFR